MLSRFNIWYLSSFFISLIVVVPILMIFGSFFETTTEYSSILKGNISIRLYF
jgi:iron(III) transport system permease protein